MLGIGLIGLGKHGSRYARHIVEDLTDAALVAVCRRNRTEGEKLAAAYRCAFHGDYRDLVANPRVDAVVVAVPPMLHPTVVEAACRAIESRSSAAACRGGRAERSSTSVPRASSRAASYIFWRCPDPRRKTCY